ncbi:hypothetical protein PG993_015133 [Apiospora rasikravindrae]|uniref:Uncharacterized protein n=1 Tax=Apiospora rasikravindrae TaxID=990691 RepID=A0ABR1RPQ8_9PEZI
MGIISIPNQTHQRIPCALAGENMIRETATGGIAARGEPGQTGGAWYSSMETGYWNALSSILIVVFIGGDTAAAGEKAGAESAAAAAYEG